MWNEDNIRQLMNDFIKECENALERRIEKIQIPIEISDRMTKTLGCFVFKQRDNDIEPIKFKFSRILLENCSYEDIVKVIKHEVMHYVVNTYYGKNVNHDARFKIHCRALNISGNATIKILPIIESIPKRYEVICEGCKKTIAKYQRMSREKKIHIICGQYRCSICKNHNLSIYDNKEKAYVYNKRN